MQLHQTPGPCVCTSVRKAGRALMRYYESAVSDTGVSITQFAILRALERNGATPLSALADELVMERTSLYRTLTPLRRQGAVSVTDADVGRAKIAELRSGGRALIERVLPHWEAAQTEVVKRLGSDQWAELSVLLLNIPNLLETRP